MQVKKNHPRVKLVTLALGQKVKYKISVTKVSFKDFFIPNFVYVLTNKRYETYPTEFSFCHLGHTPGVGLGGTLGSKT